MGVDYENVKMRMVRKERMQDVCGLGINGDCEQE